MDVLYELSDSEGLVGELAATVAGGFELLLSIPRSFCVDEG